jgi:hypothetical protein
MTRILLISMLASFVGGGTVVWLMQGPADDQEPVVTLNSASRPVPEPAGSVDAELADSRDRELSLPGDTEPVDPIPARMADVFATALSEPQAALTQALNLPNANARRSVVRHIAETAARIDPQQGIEWAITIDDRDLRTEYFRALYLEWARIDAGGLLADLPPLHATADSLLRLANATPLMDALKLASESDPIYAFEVGTRQPGALGVLVMAAALEAMAATDPSAALAR